MKLESISGNELLVKCRYSDGAKGNNLLTLYGELDFTVFDNWSRLGNQWGYVELSDKLVSIVAYAAKRTCSRKLTLKILKRLHYPNLQCAALAGVVDIHTLCDILKEWNKDADKSPSIFWSIIEVCYWRLEHYRINQPVEDWLNSEAIDYINLFYAEVINAGFEKEFIRWLFSKGYRGWHDLQNNPSVGKQLLQLMEASVVYNWKEDLFDPTFENIDYLTFVATEVDEKYPLSVHHISSVLNSYYSILGKKVITSMLLPMEDNTIAWLGGFAEMFWKEHEKNLKVETIKVLDEYQSIFEGWKVPGKIHDYNNVQNEVFIMSALLIMCMSRLNDTNERKIIFDIIKNRLFLQLHNSTDTYLEYYSVPACFARSVAKSISADILKDYDDMLIEKHHNLQCISSIMNFSFDIVMQPPSKKLCLQRWLKEQNIWERRLQTTGQRRELDTLQKVMKLICN